TQTYQPLHSVNPRPSHSYVQPLQPAASFDALPDQPTYKPLQPKQHESSLQLPNFADVKDRAADVKDRAMGGLKAAKKLPGRHSHYFHSLGFGLASGTVVTIIFMFSFFDEVIVSPFIQPSSKGVETPVI